MKNIDLISKRILVISLSISAVLLSTSLLIFSAKPVNAQTHSNVGSSQATGRYSAVGVALERSTGGIYAFFIWNTQTGTFRVIGFERTLMHSDVRDW